MPEQLSLNYSPSDSELGVSVSIEDRFLAINSLATIYAQAARARGLEQAFNDPKKRKVIATQYHSLSEAERIKDDAVIKAKAELQHIPGLVERLMQSHELDNIGFDKLDIEQGELEEVFSLRQRIGVNAGHQKRQQLLDSLNRGTSQD
jgi:hypothetical protein